EQYGAEQTGTWANLLNDPTVSSVTKDMIRSEIDASKSSLKKWNSLLFLNDYAGFSRLSDIMGKSLTRQFGVKPLLKNVSLLSVPEAGEELVQSVMEGGLEHKLLLDIEAGYGNLNSEDQLKGVGGLEVGSDGEIAKTPLASDPAPLNTFKPEDSLLAQVDPEKAKALSLDNARTLGNYILANATSSEAITEGLSGMFGGGPQWAITGAPSYFLNKKGRAKSEEAFEKLQKEAGSVIGAAAATKVQSSAQLDALTKELTLSVPEGSNAQYLKESLDDYIVAKTVLEGVGRGATDDLYELVKQQRVVNKESLKTGDMTQEEYDKANERLEKTKATIKKYQNLATYVNSEQLINTALQEEALKASKKAYQAAETQHATKKEADITDDEFKLFTDENKVEDATLKNIARKIKAAKPLTKRQQAVHAGNTSKIEEILRGPKQPDLEEVKLTTSRGQQTYSSKKENGKWVFKNKAGKEVYKDGKRNQAVRNELISQAETVQYEPNYNFDAEADVASASEKTYVKSIDASIAEQQQKQINLKSAESQLEATTQMRVEAAYRKVQDTITNSKKVSYVQNKMDDLSQRIQKSNDVGEVFILRKIQEQGEKHLAKLKEAERTKSLKKVDTPKPEMPDSNPVTQPIITDGALDDLEGGDNDPPKTSEYTDDEVDLDEILKMMIGAPTKNPQDPTKGTTLVKGTDPTPDQTPVEPSQKLKADKTIQDYVKANPQKPEIAAQSTKVGHAEINRAEGEGTTENLSNPESAAGSAFQFNTKDAIGVIKDLFELFQMNNPGEMPTYDSLLYMTASVLEAAPEDIEKFVKKVYSFISGTPATSNKRVDTKPDISDDHLLEQEHD
ncbi:MAG: hypothetical protein DRI46_14475, partial [Chloroflexi bacterium]